MQSRTSAITSPVRISPHRARIARRLTSQKMRPSHPNAAKVQPGLIMNIAARQPAKPMKETSARTRNLGRQDGFDIISSQAAERLSSP